MQTIFGTSHWNGEHWVMGCAIVLPEEEGTAMTKDELQAIIRLSESLIAAINDGGTGANGMSMAAFIEQYVPKLLAEVKQSREIVQQVADVPWYTVRDGYACAFCDREGKHPATIQHLPGCTVLKARVLLA